MRHTGKKNEKNENIKKEHSVTWRAYVGIMVYIFGAFVLYASQLLAPLHVPLAIVLLVLAFRKARTLYLRLHIEKDIHLLEKRVRHHVVLHRVLIGMVMLVCTILYVGSALIPMDKEVFTGLSFEQIEARVNEDLQSSAQLIDMLTVTGEQVLSNVALYKNDPSPSEQESLKKDWDAFLQVTIASEYVTETYRYFPQISVFNERDLHARSFTISYALYMKKFEYFHKIIEAVGTNGSARTILNEYAPSFGAKNSYTDVTERYFAGNSFLRRNVGYLYHVIMNPSASEVISPEYKILLNVADESYQYMFKNVFSHITHRGIAYTHTFNDTVSDAWLPIQKTVFVDTIGNVHVGDRTEKFITKEHIETMKQSLNPGDIFVARKNWYASNVGIPGFWTHAGLYTGTIDDMGEYFGELFPYTRDGVTYLTFDALLAQVYPEAHKTYHGFDAYGHVPSVIESETKGTSIQSIEHSATVDYFAVLRTNLEKKDILESLLRVFAHQHKPYDYEFHMHTKDEVFCSELVYDAFVPLDSKKGITFPTSVVTGKEIVSPNDIVKKFVEEDGRPRAELSFVYFIDASETEGTVHVAGKDSFKESFYRPKFSFMQE
jgi:hypothetical protein